MDYLEVFDGKDARFRSFGKFCNSNNHPLSLQTTGNNALIRMKTDVSVSQRGFLLKYVTNCNRTIYMDSGVIESPNFPENYPDNLNCVWQIVVSKGNKINMRFSEFQLENINQTDNETKVRLCQ